MTGKYEKLVVTIDSATKAEAERICRKRGTTLDEAVRAFLRVTADAGSTPFVPSRLSRAPEDAPESFAASEIDLPPAVTNALMRNGVFTDEQLSLVPDEKIRRLCGIGEKKAATIREYLREKGLRKDD